MVKEIRYTSVSRVLDSLTDHPMLRDVTLEQVVRYTMRFIEKHGYPRLYQDSIAEVEIQEYRGLLPCDLVSIIQVRDCKTGNCMVSMSDSFAEGLRREEKLPPRNAYEPYNRHTFEGHPMLEPLSFKTQGRVIYTSFPEGVVEISYKAIPVDENGFPMIPDNEVFLEALEAYIKEKVFIVKFDQNKISMQVLRQAKEDYAWAAGQCKKEFIMPSYSEMQSISNMWNSLIPRVREFDSGFKSLNQREFLRKH